MIRKFLTAFVIFSMQITWIGISDSEVSAQSRTGRFEPSSRSWNLATARLRQMSLEEKVGQMLHIGINARYAHQASPYFRELRRQVEEEKIGGILLFGAPIYESVHLVNRLQGFAKTPLLISVDAETGVGMRFSDATNFPWKMALGATGDAGLAERMGVITGREARALGILHVYAPVLDVNNNPENPVINVRSFGEDPALVGRLGAAFIRGLQSQRVIATAKHFPGHGDTEVDSHRGLPMIDVSRERLDRIELPPFKAAIDAGVGSIMIAHVGLPQIDPETVKPISNALRVDAEEGAELVTENATVPATLSYKIQTDILRKEMGFRGLIVTDAMSMSGLTLYFDQGEAGVRAVLAGADILEKPADLGAMINGIKKAVRSGRIPMSRIDDAVRRILAWKFELGLFRNKITPLGGIDSIVSGPETLDLATEIAERAITLVRNEKGALPLEKSRRTVFIGVSNGFDGDATAASFNRTLRENGMRHQSFMIQENTSVETVTRAKAAMDEAEVVIVGLYGRVRTGAKNSVGLPEKGVALVREAIKDGKQVIGIGFGNPYSLLVFPEMKTYIATYGDMGSLQRAAGRAMMGRTDFSGRLPVSIPGLHPIGHGIETNNTK
jgi:beta-N-acetylhexosaminidase